MSVESSEEWGSHPIDQPIHGKHAGIGEAWEVEAKHTRSPVAQAVSLDITETFGISFVPDLFEERGDHDRYRRHGRIGDRILSAPLAE